MIFLGYPSEQTYQSFFYPLLCLNTGVFAGVEAPEFKTTALSTLKYH
jgi:hypothetical protein